MRICIPGSPGTRYLTGMDWVIGALDHQNRRNIGCSNASQIVIELEGPVSTPDFESAIRAYVQLFPVLGGRVARDWNIAPCWRMARAGSRIPVTVESAPLHGRDPLDAATAGINTAFAERRQRVAFRLFHGDADRHFLAMRFDHLVFDAHGAERFLDLFEQWRTGRVSSDTLAALRLTEPVHLSDWQRKFDAGRPFVRKLRELSRCPIAVLPRPASPSGRGFRFHMLAFDAAQTQAIVARADQEAGYLLFSVYVLAVAMQSLAPAFPDGARAAGELLVSASVDARLPDAGLDRMFFNHLSFLLFREPLARAADRAALMASVRTQMYEQARDRFPQNLAEASMLMRILPRRVLGRLMLLPMHGELASFGFACPGRGGFAQPVFLGARVVNLFHMPLIPSPPALGIVVNRFRDRMNVVLCHLDGMLDDRAAGAILANLRQWL